MAGAEAKNMRLIAHDTLAGFGGIGEGMSLQVTSGGRRVLWLAHESAPKNCPTATCAPTRSRCAAT
jgi:hypothetical protein